MEGRACWIETEISGKAFEVFITGIISNIYSTSCKAFSLWFPKGANYCLGTAVLKIGSDAQNPSKEERIIILVGRCARMNGTRVLLLHPVISPVHS